MSLPSFPRSVPTPGAALCSAGSLGSVPPLRRSYCGAPNSRRPDRARFPRADVPARAGTARPPRFLGNPCVRALVADPGGSGCRGPGRMPCALAVPMVPSASTIASASTTAFRGSIPQPARPLSTLRDRRHRRPRKTRFRLLTSCLAVGTFTRGLRSRVSVRSNLLSGQACLAHGRSRSCPRGDCEEMSSRSATAVGAVAPVAWACTWLPCPCRRGDRASRVRRRSSDGSREDSRATSARSGVPAPVRAWADRRVATSMPRAGRSPADATR